MRFLPLILLAACAGPPHGAPVVALDELAPSQGPVILRIPAGTRLPITIDTDLPFARQEGGTLHLVFAEDVYWYAPRPAYISHDGRTWRRMTGRLQIGVGRNGTDPPQGRVSLTVRD